MVESTQPANGLAAFSPGRPKPTLCLTSETSGNALPEVFNLTVSFAALLDDSLECARCSGADINSRPPASRTSPVQARKFVIAA
jgi:hypothetical protein